jgi:hypothetical protein
VSAGHGDHSELWSCIEVLGTRLADAERRLAAAEADNSVLMDKIVGRVAAGAPLLPAADRAAERWGLGYRVDAISRILAKGFEAEGLPVPEVLRTEPPAALLPAADRAAERWGVQ